MNLCDRLQRSTPCGYGQRYYFEYLNGYGWDKSAVIYCVVERYAKRFGAITESHANSLYELLAKKYCIGIGWLSCYRSIEIDICKDAKSVYFAHPKEVMLNSRNLKAQLYKESCRIKDDIKSVEVATNQADGPYMVLRSGSGYCRLCDRNTEYMLCHDNLPNGRERCRIWQNGFPGICRRPMCKALVKKFPKQCKSRTNFPMAKIILELTKNGDRCGIIREIKEIASRDIYTTHNRRGRKKESACIGAIGN